MDCKDRTAKEKERQFRERTSTVTEGKDRQFRDKTGSHVTEEAVTGKGQVV